MAAIFPLQCQFAEWNCAELPNRITPNYRMGLRQTTEWLLCGGALFDILLTK
jgi:hypothetical protein